MFILSKQEKIVLLFLVTVLIVIFGWRLYFSGKSSITIIPAQMESQINSQNSTKIVDEEICIIHITGAVQKPGVYQLAEGKRIIDAVELAGGVTERANLDAVNLAARIYDGQKIIIPYISHNLENEESKINELYMISPEYIYSGNSHLININTAGIPELESLPGIGTTLANRIVEYRKNNGTFRKVEDIKNVSGIGEKKFEAIKELITVY